MIPERLSDYEYKKWATRQSSINREYCFMEVASELGLKQWITLPEDQSNRTYYVEKGSFHTFLQTLMDQIATDWKDHLQRYESVKTKFLTTAERLGEQQSLQAYDQFLDAGRSFTEYILGSFAVTHCIEPELKDELGDDFGKVVLPDRPTTFQQMQRKLVKKPVEDVAEEYDWLNVYSIREQPYDVDYFRKLKEEISEEEIENTFAEFDSNQARYREFLQTLDDALQWKAKLLHEYVYLKNDRIDTWKRAMYLIQPFFKHVASQWETVSFKETANLTPHEIRMALRGKLDKSVPETRKGPFGYYYSDSIHVIESDELDQVRSTVVEDYDTDKITGTSGNEGVARGTVRVVESPDELDKVQEGDVLVARVTDPRYTPYMRECCAVVTDEGGMLSHAVLTSREIGVPCVVGTEGATEFFEDGETVKVDADEGVVVKDG